MEPAEKKTASPENDAKLEQLMEQVLSASEGEVNVTFNIQAETVQIADRGGKIQSVGSRGLLVDGSVEGVEGSAFGPGASYQGDKRD